ncbi:MAG: PqqD family peptide modification chaperone [Candidatus Aminicenantes bacterium]|nr:PqqD family peptide modification chaperone [Candidatus Aminicenantes bacterium]
MNKIDPKQIPIRSPIISVRQWDKNAILFNPDTNKSKTINPTGFFIWKKSDGRHSIKDISEKIKKSYDFVPSFELQNDITHFLGELYNEKYITLNSNTYPQILKKEKYPDASDAPFDFDISLTGKCNLHCPYCFYAKEMRHRKDLPVEDWYTFFKELNNLSVRDLTLSGGEVFTHPNLGELIDSIIDNKMRYSLLTNGTLINEKTISFLEKEKRRKRLNYIQISIDGSCPEIHDKSRGKGSFDKSIKGFSLLKEAKFPVTSRVTINRNNVGDLENIARLLLGEIGLASFGTNDAMPMGSGCDNQATIVLTPKQQLQAIITMHRLEQQYNGRITATAGPLAKWKTYGEMELARKTGEKTTSWKMGFLTACGCMYNKLAIHHDGKISPCNILSELEIGKINQDSIKTIWKTHPILKALKSRRTIPMHEVEGCENCEWAPYCNGSCPGLAFTMTGDFNRANPHDCYKKFLADTGLNSSTVPWKPD